MPRPGMTVKRLPHGGFVAFSPSDPRSVDLLCRLHRSRGAAARVFVNMLQHAPAAGRALVAVGSNDVAAASLCAGLLDAVSELLKSPIHSAAVTLASDHVRATVALRTGENETVFVKARVDDGARLRALAARLEELGPVCPDTCRIPEVLAAGEVGEWSMVVLSDVGSRDRIGRIRPLGELIDYLNGLRCIGEERVAFRQALEMLSTGSAGSTPDAAGLIGRLKEKVNGRDVLLSLAHGDFVPWNLELTDGILRLWDWEKAIRRAPWPYDAIHYAFETRRCIDGESVSVAIHCAITQLAQHSASLGIPSDDDSVLELCALYAACRSVNEERLERTSTDGQELVRVLSDMI